MCAHVWCVYYTDSSSGVIGRNPNKTIDREQVASYQLVVVAVDAGNPTRNSSVNVTMVCAHVVV